MNMAKEYRKETGFKWPDPPAEECQLDMFGNGKSTDEIQLEKALEIVQCAGYRVVKCMEDIKEVAIDHGYKVTEPIVVDDKIVTLLDLREYFFKRMWDRYPDGYLHYVDNRKGELNLIRRMVEAREKTGMNKFRAVQECVRIIDVIFDYEKEFRFKSPINIRVLGQDKAGWITQKAITILTNKEEEKQNIEFKKLIDAREAEGVDLKQRANELDRLLANMEANNG